MNPRYTDSTVDSCSSKCGSLQYYSSAIEEYQGYTYSSFDELKRSIKETWMKLAGGLVAVLLILIFVKIPYNTSANIEILPKQKTYFQWRREKLGNY